jgi:hypothetical protein
MFEEVKEMIDSTVYTNGNGEVTAQNINLAMHGMVDATEGELVDMKDTVVETNTKIDGIVKQIEEGEIGGLGGLEFSFPLALVSFLEVYPTDFMFDKETTAAIIEEMPSLAEPIDKMFEKNAKAYAKYVAALEKGEAPIVSIKLTDLAKEVMEIMEGEDVAAIIPDVYVVASGTSTSQTFLACQVVIGPMNMTVGLLLDGSCGLIEYTEPLSITIPVSGEVYDNSYEIETLNRGNDAQNNNTYQYRVPNGASYNYETIFPVHIKESELGKKHIIRFVVNAELIEAIIDNESGNTTSRVIAKMTPEEVGVIAEGTLSRVHNLTYPYYEILPAEGNAVVSLQIKSTVPWTLYDGQTSLISGEAGSHMHEYVVEANTLTEPLNHNYRLVANADGEELAILWITQAAAAATETTEQVTEE